MNKLSATPRPKVSGVVLSYNRADIIETCLKALWFVDELIVVDKSSTDGTAELAAKIADRVIIEPWKPLGEDSRESAVAACSHDWVVCMDDDECLSVEAGRFIQQELDAPRASMYLLPLRHYILGEHDECAYYWPEQKPRFFRKNAVAFRSTIHGEWVYRQEDCFYGPFPDGVCIHHLTHKDVSQWIEKTNRYTSNHDRIRQGGEAVDLVAFAHKQIDHYANASKTDDRTGYPAAVAVLRGLYDIVDRLKTWEEERGVDGGRAFRDVCKALEAQYEGMPARSRIPSPAMTTLAAYCGKFLLRHRWKAPAESESLRR